jgi:hypothetical protein
MVFISGKQKILIFFSSSIFVEQAAKSNGKKSVLFFDFLLNKSGLGKVSSDISRRKNKIYAFLLGRFSVKE